MVYYNLDGLGQLTIQPRSATHLTRFPASRTFTLAVY